MSTGTLPGLAMAVCGVAHRATAGARLVPLHGLLRLGQARGPQRRPGGPGPGRSGWRAIPDARLSLSATPTGRAARPQPRVAQAGRNGPRRAGEARSPAERDLHRSFGEERPLVPTEDGVREVQNRRVEIIVSQ